MKKKKSPLKIVESGQKMFDSYDEMLEPNLNNG